MSCAVRRCWKAASPRRPSRPCEGRCSSRITHRSSRCYLGRRSWEPIIRPIRTKQSRFCVRPWHARPKRRSAIPSSQWPMAEREISQRPTWHRRMPLAASAQSFSDSQRGDIETIVRNYLLAHPEVLEEAMAELSKRQAAADTEKHEASVAKNAETIFNSPRGVTVGNKDGDVTFVEFFDYNCGYCKRAMADMLDLMKSDSKLKVVLKEFPVLWPGSVEAAQVAVAARR